MDLVLFFSQIEARRQTVGILENSSYFFSCFSRGVLYSGFINQLSMFFDKGNSLTLKLLQIFIECLQENKCSCNQFIYFQTLAVSQRIICQITVSKKNWKLYVGEVNRKFVSDLIIKKLLSLCDSLLCSILHIFWF